jgi:polygalacturonase
MKKLTSLLVIQLLLLFGSPALSDTLMLEMLDVRDRGRGVYRISHWLEQGNIQVGRAVYGDEAAITITSIPEQYAGDDWIQPAYASREFTVDQTLVKFKLRGDAQVLIAHDDSIKTKPAWLADWEKTGGQITSSRPACFSLYVRNFKKGTTVELGQNGTAKEEMYFVLLKPDGAAPQYAVPPGKVFDVRDYGAIGDNLTLNTESVQKAIDACSAEGGGSVYIDGGAYKTGTLELKDNVTLYIQSGSILRGTRKVEDYPPKECELLYYRSGEHLQLIYAEKRRNISVQGGGIIDGDDLPTHEWPSNGTAKRPRLIRFVECQNTVVRDITLMRPASWTHLYVACNDLLIDNVKVRSYTGRKNQDGLDIDSCQRTIVRNCHIISGDDGICLKAMSMRPGKDIEIYDNVVDSHSAGFKIGTETHGGWENVHIRDCLISCNRSGIGVEAVDGAHIENVLVENILLEASHTPIFIRLADRGRKLKGQAEKTRMGSIKNVTIRNVVATGTMKTHGSSITAIEGIYVEEVHLTNLKLAFIGANTGKNTAYAKVPENIDAYPKPDLFDKMDLPAYGIYVRHVKHISLENVELSYEEEDVRPALVFDDVVKYQLDDVQAQNNARTTPSVFWHVQDGIVNSQK